MKKRTAFRDDGERLEVFERGKLPRGYFTARDGRNVPSPDVRDLVDVQLLDKLRWRLRKLCMTFLKPASLSKGTGSSCAVVSPGSLLSAFSEVWGFLTSTQYGDGAKREPGCISLKCSSNGLQVTLTDSTSGSFCCLTGNSLDDLFLNLEIGLKENSLPWRTSSYGKSRK